MPPALRPAVVVLLAMLAAEGTTVLRNVYVINRNYEDLAERLNEVGARIGTFAASDRWAVAPFLTTHGEAGFGRGNGACGNTAKAGWDPPHAHCDVQQSRVVTTDAIYR